MAGRTILLRPCHGRKDEALTNAAGFLPGQLVRLNSAGKIILHATIHGHGPRKILIEDAVWGKTVDDAFAANVNAPFYNFSPEGKFNFRCKEGFNYTVGTLLVSNGDGNFRPYIAGTSLQVFGEVRTALDLTAAGAPALVEADAI